jgi:branched-chain amino acid aminotransferase
VKFYNVNGSLLNETAAFIPVENRGFRYADGFFESIRFTRNSIHLWDLHYERILASFKILKIENPKEGFKEILFNAIMETVKANTQGTEARVRVIFTRDSGGLYEPVSRTFWYFIEAEKIEGEGYTMNSKGLIVDLFTDYKKQKNALSNLKSLNSQLFVLAGCQIQDTDLNSVIILNENGSLCEGHNSNLFLAVNGVIYTPSISEGCVDGVMRRYVIELAARNGIKVYETELKPNDLIRSDEIFYTNAIKGISWVGAYKSKRYYNNISRKLSDLLNESLNQLV